MFDKYADLTDNINIIVVNIFKKNLAMDLAMKPSVLSTSQFLFSFVFVSFFCVVNVLAKNDDKVQFKMENLTIDIGGKHLNEAYFSNNLSFLNAGSPIDSISYVRTTFDFFSTFSQGNYENPRIVFYDTLRFRFKWGSNTDIRNEDGFITLGNSRLGVGGTATNKHLLWMRESWIKIMLGSLDEHQNFVQIGLIPYEVGRGISFGKAYEAIGFLGFNPGSSIDQYAPAVLFSFNPIVDRFVVDAYVALVENRQTSLRENNESIRKNELDNACDIRGVGRQSFITVLRNETCVYRRDKESVMFEPYFVHQHAPDQDLEFTNDVDTFLSTAGIAIESVGNRFSWGIEGARNFGEVDIKAWDRNYSKVVKDNDGFLEEQFTKVYTQNPATTKKPQAATNTKAIAALLAGSPKDRSMNGKLVGTVGGQDIYNAFDRFRPEQRRSLEGFFFVADAAYDCIPKILNWAIGVGYASGYIDQQRDNNKATTEELLNEQYTGFLPLQSVYSGKRLRHLVIFNQGVPRFNVKYPNADLSQVNNTVVLQTDTVNEMTNIAFLGTRFDWNVKSFKKYRLNLAQNIISYWAPVTAHFVTSDPGATLITSEESSNFLGTEFTTEFSAWFYDKIKLAGYFGVLFPGQHYKDMAGTVIAKFNQKTGSDIAYVGNFGVAYLF